MSIKYSLGLDLGVTSIGWSALILDEDGLPNRILDTGVVLFDALDGDRSGLKNVARREARGSRRTTRRRRERIRRVKQLLTNELGINNFDELFHEKNNEQPEFLNDVKIKGLHNPLTKDELARILINYVKQRGFKSNRKKIDNKDTEELKYKGAINAINKIMEENDNLYFSQVVKLIKEREKLDTYHNQNGNFYYGFNRIDIEAEIDQILKTQLEASLINKKFKDEYLKIFSNQRDFSEGPGYAEGKHHDINDKDRKKSPYAVDFENLFGKCSFYPEENRVSKATPSFEKYVALGKLVNLVYYSKGESGVPNWKNKHFLSDIQVKKLIDKFMEKKKLTYKDIFDEIGNDVILDKQSSMNFEITKDAFNKQVEKIKLKYDLPLNQALPEEYRPEVQEEVQKEKMKKDFFEAKSYKNLISQLNKLEKNDENDDNDKEYIKKLKSNIDKLDLFATILAYAQTDKAIEEKFEEFQERYPEIKLNEIDLDIIKALDINVAGSGNLSLKLVKELNEQMEKGLQYDVALKAINPDFNHALLEGVIERANIKKDFPSVNEIEEYYNTSITQPNVKHMLSIFRKFYVALVNKHGHPDVINIELARELAKSRDERNTIRNEQKQRFLNKKEARYDLFKLLGNKAFSNKSSEYQNFSNEDIDRYLLWKEQNKLSMYSGEEIKPEQLLTNEVEIDHIIPYSLSFDDSFNNKVLVLRKENQEKGNKIPYTYLKAIKQWDQFVNRIENNSNLSQYKKERLLRTTLDSEDAEQLKGEALHATAYFSTLIHRIFKDLYDEKAQVNTFKGQMTSNLRRYYNLNGITSSIETTLEYKRTDNGIPTGDERYQRVNIPYYIDDKSIKIDPVKQDNKKTKTNEDSITYTLKCEISATNPFGANIKYTYSNRFNSFYQTKDDEQLLSLFMKKEYLLEKLQEIFLKKNIFDIDDREVLIDLSSKYNDSALSFLVMNILDGLKQEVNQKNRDNVLHHQVDATLLAIMTKSMEQRISKFKKYLDGFDNNGKYTDPDTGEVFTKDSLQKAYVYDNKNMPNIFKTIPLPYAGFREELIYRIFERDEEILKINLEKLTENILAQGESAPIYSQEDLTKIHVKYPHYVLEKRESGPLHEETIFGLSKDNGEDVLTKRISVIGITSNDIEKIVDKNGGNKEVYETIKEWSKNKKTEYPTLKNGHIIKKVKIIESTDLKSRFMINEDTKAHAKGGNVVAIDIYKNKDERDDKVYFASRQMLEYRQDKNDEDYDIKLWWGRGKNHKYINSNKINEEYYKLLTLLPGEIIKLNTKNSSYKTLCKVIGFTTGKFEIDSILGDGYDLLLSDIVGKLRSQYQLTITTINFIQKITIDILGNIHYKEEYLL